MGLNLVGKIELDGAGFERGLHKAGEHVADFVKNATVAAFGFYGVEEAIRKTVETASELVNESKRLDVTVEQLQLLRQAAKDGGTEMGALASAFEKLDIARSKALAGDKGALTAFAKLGVSQADLKNKTAADIFTGSLSNAAKNNSVEDIGPALKEILGKGFGELIPVLKTDFEELEGKMKSLGSIMDTETAVKLKALGDNFDLLKNILTAQLAPALLSIVEVILMVIGKIKEAAAFLGGATSNMTAADWIKLIAAPYLPQKNLDPKAGADAAIDAEKEWKDSLDAIRKKIAADAEELNHPKPRSGAVDPDATKTTAQRKLANVPSDALVKVGNFLGSNGNTIERVNQQKIQLLTRIADSNDKLVMKIAAMGGIGAGNFGGLGIPIN